ncbi:hypothetical protein ABZT17_26830 [Streptomyces sp. NPDC005648]|uniref:hypothetical protein n=1 Tax=Streptomyces sp. NPDC005648 TaxID=3157044 RepID=UPI0033B95301
MRTPALLRRWRSQLSDAQTNRLRVQLADERGRNKQLERRVADLQAANEGAYHELAIANGNPCLKTSCSLCAPAQRQVNA